MNVERLLAVKQAILDHPKQLHMQSWYSGAAISLILETETVPMLLGRECDTAGCIAGWATSLFAPRTKYGENGTGVPDAAAEILGLTGEQDMALFHLCFWPGDLSRRYRLAKRPTTRARIVAERIDRFLVEHGAVVPEPSGNPQLQAAR